MEHGGWTPQTLFVIKASGLPPCRCARASVFNCCWQMGRTLKASDLKIVRGPDLDSLRRTQGPASRRAERQAGPCDPGHTG